MFYNLLLNDSLRESYLFSFNADSKFREVIYSLNSFMLFLPILFLIGLFIFCTLFYNSFEMELSKFWLLFSYFFGDRTLFFNGMFKFRPSLNSDMLMLWLLSYLNNVIYFSIFLISTSSSSYDLIKST